MPPMSDTGARNNWVINSQATTFSVQAHAMYHS